MNKNNVLKYMRLLIILGLCVFFVGCSADVNVAKCEMNVKQGDTDILCDTGYFNFGNIPLGYSQSITFTIENTGFDTLHLPGNPRVEIIGQDASDFIAATNLTASAVPADSDTTFRIQFKPNSIGTKTATISIANDDRDENPYTFAVVGTGTQPAPEIHVRQDTTDILCITGSYDFGSVNINESSDQITFTIENNGNEILNLTGTERIAISGTDAAMFAINQNHTFDKITSNNSTTFKISFKPTSAGIKTAKISILNDDSDENPYTFTIKGTAVASPEIDVKQDTVSIESGSGKYTFADTIVNESTEVMFTIENNGTAALHLENLNISGTDAAMFTKNTNSTDEFVTQGNTTSFSITFAPTSTGLKTATVTIDNNDSNENPFTYTIEGKGVVSEINVKYGSADILNGTGSHDFGLIPVGGSSYLVSFTIENLGTGNLELTGSPKVDKTGSDSSMFEIDDTSTVSPVKPGQSTTFKVKFSPTDGGNRSATISIANNDDDENPYTFTVTGEGENDAAIGWIGGGSNGWKTGTAPTSGSDYKSFYYQNGISLDSSGNIYVADTRNNRITKWDKDGNAIGWIGGGSDGWKTGSAPSSGSDYQSFNNPNCITLDSEGKIYVSDAGNNRICKWDSSGNAIGWIGGGNNGWKTTSAPSSFGSDFRSFNYPFGMIVDSSGSIYISDNSNCRVCKWDKDGNALGWIGGGSNGWKTSTAPPMYAVDYQSFFFPDGLCFDSNGNILVADSANDRICKWDKNGNAIGWIGGGSSGWKTTPALPDPANGGDDYQSFECPTSVSVTSSGIIYICDRNNHRICKWNSSGNAIGWLGDGSNGWKTHSNSSSGTDYQSFKTPMFVFVDSLDNIFVSDWANCRICKWHD